MTTQKKQIQATTEPILGELQLEGLRMVQKNAFKRKIEKEREQDIANAEAYSLECEHKRQQRKDKALAIILGIVCAGALSVMVACSNTEPRYAIASESDNGMHYIYVTDRECEVTEITDNLVTVEYKGNFYAFYGKGYKVGDEVICKFTDNWEIIDAKKG